MPGVGGSDSLTREGLPGAEVGFVPRSNPHTLPSSGSLGPPPSPTWTSGVRGAVWSLLQHSQNFFDLVVSSL